ncbi:MAG: hypothetical protein ACYCW6_06625, partial [Candidatus Xenobia bacterium]
VIPGDQPFLTIQAVEDFVAAMQEHPGDFHYAWLTREDSEREYPGLEHTYAPLKEGWLCGTGLIAMRPSVLVHARRVMDAAVAARKSPFQIVTILGLKQIVKFIFRQLSVRDCENRISTLLNCKVVALRTRHACAGFNVDKAEQLTLARRLLDH